MKKLIICMFQFYREAVSPYMGARCRYIPSCSEYMQEAIQGRGVLKGIIHGFRRLSRCRPLGGSGFDPHIR